MKDLHFFCGITCSDVVNGLWPRIAQLCWESRITQRVEAQQLHWESVGGLPTKGAVRFYPEADDRTVVKLSVTYELPRVLAPLMEPSILGGIVTKELQANLDRFRDLVEAGG